MVSIDGNKASPIFYLLISKKGETTFPSRTKQRLQVRYVKTDAAIDKLSNKELKSVTQDLVDAMRSFEANNKDGFENEWHVIGTPQEKGSYRYAFEQYRKRALEVRAELWKRLQSQPATTIALDADSLAGASPITDAANYLETLSRQLPDVESTVVAPSI